MILESEGVIEIIGKNVNQKWEKEPSYGNEEIKRRINEKMRRFKDIY